MLIDRVLNFSCAQVMSRYYNYIIYPASDTVVSVVIAFTSIAGEIFSRKSRKVSVFKPLMISIDGARDRRPRKFYRKSSFCNSIGTFLSIFAYDGRLYPRQWQRCKGWLEGCNMSNW